MLQNPQETTEGIEWFATNLPKEYLNHPQYFLYQIALEVERLEDTEENRRKFKTALIEHQIMEEIPLPDVNQKDIDAFANPADDTLRISRAEQITALTAKYLKMGSRLAQAQRMAIEELFHQESPFTIAPMDESYFRNRELVEADLRAFLEHADGESLRDLSTINPKANVKIIAHAGEDITWDTYLHYASRYLFGTNQKRKEKNPHKAGEALNHLKILCGVVFMDEKYFNNSYYVKYDLEKFKEVKGCNSIYDLIGHASSSDNKEITAINGEKIKWNNYLRRASVFLFDTKPESDNPHNLKKALDYLKRICGQIDMDESYFANRKYIEADLRAFLGHAKGNSLHNLTVTNPIVTTQVVIDRVGTISWQSYLKRASAVLLGTAEGGQPKWGDNPPRKADALHKLKELCGLFFIDKEYLNNPDYVKADLETAVKSCDQCNSIADLNATTNPEWDTEIVAKNGQIFTWRNYLHNASAILFGTAYKGDNPHDLFRILNHLKKLCGVIIIDREYFNNTEYVRSDLANFIKHMDINLIGDLTTTRLDWSVRIITVSGESITWQSYLDRVSSIVFGTKQGNKRKKSKNPHSRSKALYYLQKLCGVIFMDEKYLNNPKYVKADLEEFLKHVEEYDSIEDLKVTNPRGSKKIITYGGQTISWTSYLRSASGLLFGTDGKKGDNYHRPLEALEKLKQIATQADETTSKPS